MRNMKNTVLSFVTGLAVGSILLGASAIGLNNGLAFVLITFGLGWTIPFCYVNKNKFMKLWESFNYDDVED